MWTSIFPTPWLCCSTPQSVLLLPHAAQTQVPVDPCTTVHDGSAARLPAAAQSALHQLPGFQCAPHGGAVSGALLALDVEPGAGCADRGLPGAVCVRHLLCTSVLLCSRKHGLEPGTRVARLPHGGGRLHRDICYWVHHHRAGPQRPPDGLSSITLVLEHFRAAAEDVSSWAQATYIPGVTGDGWHGNCLPPSGPWCTGHLIVHRGPWPDHRSNPSQVIPWPAQPPGPHHHHQRCVLPQDPPAPCQPLCSLLLPGTTQLWTGPWCLLPSTYHPGTMASIPWLEANIPSTVNITFNSIRYIIFCDPRQTDASP